MRRHWQMIERVASAFEQRGALSDVAIGRSWTGNGRLTPARALATLDCGPISLAVFGTLRLVDVEKEAEMREIEVAGLFSDEFVGERHDQGERVGRRCLFHFCSQHSCVDLHFSE